MTATRQQAAFGAEFDSPSRTAALLRARALTLGVDIAPTPDCDLIASVVAAHTWLVTSRSTSLAVVSSPDAAAALAAIYCRAAGQALSGADAIAGRTDELATTVAAANRTILDAAQLRQISDAARWASRHDCPEALLIAAEDLAAGINHPALAAGIDALLTLAADQFA